MVPAINDIRRSLSDCNSCFDRLAGVRPVTDRMVVCNTMFAEFAVDWQGERWLLSTPLSANAVQTIGSMARMAVKLRAARPQHIAEYRVFHSELRFADSAGGQHRCDVVMQLRPDGDTLDRVASVSSHERMLEQIESMQAEFARIGFAHNNLKPENIIVTADERLIAMRCHFARMGGDADTGAGGNDGRAFEALRRYVLSKPLDDVPGDGRCEVVNAVAAGYEVAGGECEQRILILRDGVYGYADHRGDVVIEPQFNRAESFREGRAEVELNGLKGLIDKDGKWVVPARCDELEYFDDNGFSLVHYAGRWSVLDYDGNPTGISHADVEEVCRRMKERMNVTIEI